MSLFEKVKKWEKRIYLTLAVALAINSASIPITFLINRNIKSEEETAVLSSGYSRMNWPGGLISGVIDFFMYTPITLRQNLMGRKVDWFSNPTRDEVLDVLLDEQYQNLVLIGHGDRNVIPTPNGYVWAHQLAEMDLPERQGEFIRHTCGLAEGLSLREVLYPNGSTGYGFDKNVRAIVNYGRAITELFRR